MCMCVCLYVRMYVRACACVHARASVLAWVRLCEWVSACVSMYVCMYVYMCARAYVRACVRVSVCVCYLCMATTHTQLTLLRDVLLLLCVNETKTGSCASCSVTGKFAYKVSFCP